MSDAIKGHFDRLYAPVEEALKTLHAHMPWGLQIPLSDGRVLTLKKFTEVEERDGRFEFGFDLANDSIHLEFYVKHTGGGGAPALDLASEIISALREGGQ